MQIEQGVYVTDSVAGSVGKTYTLSFEFENRTYQGSDMIVSITSHDTVDYVDEGSYYSFPYRPHQFGFEDAAKFEVNVFLPDSILQRQNDLPEDLLKRIMSRTFVFYAHPKFEPNGVFEFVATDHKAYQDRGYWVKQKKFSISELHYSYLRALFSETDWRGSLLDSQAGEIPTNMIELQTGKKADIQGFFSAMAVDELLYRFPVK